MNHPFGSFTAAGCEFTSGNTMPSTRPMPTIRDCEFTAREKFLNLASRALPVFVDCTFRLENGSEIPIPNTTRRHP
jgi:hypothetical protein